MRKQDCFFRFVSVKDGAFPTYYYHEETPQELQQFIAETPEKIMQNVMNFVSGKKTGNPLSDRVYDIYNHAKKGGGLTCNGMSELYVHALRISGFKARKLFAVSSLGNQGMTHTIVEVFLHGAWRVFDPTFNTSFKRLANNGSNQLLGAQELSNALSDGTFKEIVPVFYGEVAYSARLEKYPIYWLLHYHVLLLFQHSKLPSGYISGLVTLPMRYWYGPILYYYDCKGSANAYIDALNVWYFITVFLIPALMFLLLMVLLIVFIKRGKNV